MNRYQLLAASAVALLLTGCINQKVEVLQYRKVLDGPTATIPTTQPSNPAAPLTLADALRTANRHNDQLSISGEDYVLALIDKARAAGTFLPRISFAPAFTNMETFNYPSFGGPTASTSGFAKFYPQDYTDLPINTTIQTNVVKDLYEVSRTARTIEQRKALLLDLQQTTFYNVAQTYYAILQAEQSVRTLTTSVKVQEERVKMMQHRAEQGLARRLDVAQSLADAASAKVRLTNSKNDVIHNRATLAFLMGVDEIDVALKDDFVAPKAIDAADDSLHVARLHRQDLIAAAHGVRAGAAAIRSAWGQYAPSLSFNLNTFLYREGFPQDSWWSSLVTINLPLFEEGIIHNNVREAYARFRQDVDRARQTDHQINEDIKNATADFYASQARVRDLIVAERAARDAYDAATNEYGSGTATNLDVLTAQDSQLVAQLQLDNERYTAKLTYVGILRMTGMLDRESIDRLDAQVAATQNAPAPSKPTIAETFATTQPSTVKTEPVNHTPGLDADVNTDPPATTTTVTTVTTTVTKMSTNSQPQP